MTTIWLRGRYYSKLSPQPTHQLILDIFKLVPLQVLLNSSLHLVVAQKMKRAKQKKKTKSVEKSRKRKDAKKKKKQKKEDKRRKDAIDRRDRDQDHGSVNVKEIIEDEWDDLEVEIREEDPEAGIDHAVGIGGEDQDLGNGSIHVKQKCNVEIF